MPNNQKLSILMLAQYFHPYDRGGSEQSTYFLAENLIQKSFQIKILTPNYGTQSAQIWKGLSITRFSAGVKLKNPKSAVTPFWYTNIYWHIQVFLSLLKMVNHQSIDVIHIQSPHFLPAAVLISRLKKIPTVFTARDYQIICNLGLCLWKKSHRCSLFEFITQNIPQYQQLYQTTTSPLKKMLFTLFHLRLRFSSKILRWFSTQTNQIVCISKAQQKIFAANNLTNTKVIYNTTRFPQKISNTKSDQVTFIGRLTPGKGAHLIIPAFVNAKLPTATKLVIIGSGILSRLLYKQIKNLSKTYRITFKGQLSHNQVISQIKKSKLVLAPSLWPEPFGRVALEAISQGTPVISSNKGGLPEIIQKKYGVSVNPTVNNLSRAITTTYKKQKTITKNIQKNFSKLTDQFNHAPVNQYISIYKKLTS